MNPKNIYVRQSRVVYSPLLRGIVFQNRQTTLAEELYVIHWLLNAGITGYPFKADMGRICPLTFHKGN